MKIKFWGTRGSLPSPKTPDEIRLLIEKAVHIFFQGGYNSPHDIGKFLSSPSVHKLGGYGGNTSCTEVTTLNTKIIIDGGTGLREFYSEMLRLPIEQKTKTFHIFLTHFHWDHLLGLPFFPPMYAKGVEIHFYAVQKQLESAIRMLFQKPMFPVAFEKLSSKITFHNLEARKPYVIGELKITPYQLDHPDPCWGFKIQDDHSSYAHCVDTECLRVSAKDLGDDLPLYQGIDLMLFDAQYTLEDAINRLYWGHAASAFGLDIAMREGIKQVLFVHHDPAASDDDIQEAKRQTQHYYESQLDSFSKSQTSFYTVNWDFIGDGYSVSI